MLLITIFVKLRRRGSRKKPNAVRKPTGRISTAVLCRGLEKSGMVRAWHGRGMASVNQTRPHCVNQMGKIHSKPLAACERHGCGMGAACYVGIGLKARSRNRCCRRKAIRITYSECVFVALVIQHAKRTRRIILSSVA
jgi:hypothetical protein